MAGGCRRDTAENMVNDAQDMAQDMTEGAKDVIDDIEKSIFPAELENEDSEYFKVDSSSSKDNMVTLTGTVMKKIDGSDGGTEYEYGKQDSELTFDADHADITFYDEATSDDSTVKFSAYLETYGDQIKDKIFKIDIENGIVTSIEEADYQSDGMR